MSDLPDLDKEFNFNGDVHTAFEYLDENQDSRTVAVMVSDPILLTDSTDSTDPTDSTDSTASTRSTDSPDAVYLKVIKNATEDHKKKHWIKIDKKRYRL